MKKPTPSYQRHRFPSEIISHAVWLYHRFCLSFREVEELLAKRGISVTYETIRQWSYGQKTRTPCLVRIYLTTSAFLSHLSLPSPIPDSPHQEESHHYQVGKLWSGKRYSPILQER